MISATVDTLVLGGCPITSFDAYFLYESYADYL